MPVEKDHAVFFHYELRDDAGELLDSSEGANPLGYLHGHRNIISGLERSLEGRSVGDKFVVTLEPKDAYGDWDEDRLDTVSRSSLASVDNLEVGMVLQATFDEGEELVTVTEVGDDEVTLDSNHPLAGERLTFDVEITEIRPATAEELSHGHIHAHGHHH